MARQRAAARKAWAGSGEAATEALWFEVRERVGATEFLGYDAEEAEGQIVALVVDGKEVQQASADGVLGQEVMLVTNQTPFYGERSEEHTSELQSLMRISYAVFCLKKKKT